MLPTLRLSLLPSLGLWRMVILVYSQGCQVISLFYSLLWISTPNLTAKLWAIICQASLLAMINWEVNWHCATPQIFFYNQTFL